MNPGQEPASHVPPDRPAPQRSQVYFIERPNGIRKEAPTSSAPPIPSNPSEGVLTVGPIRKWRQDAETASQGLFFDRWAKRHVNFH